MMTTDSNWPVLSLFPFVGCCLGMLGLLYLAYDLSGRQSKVMYRWVWVFSSGFLFAVVLMVSCLLLIATEPPTGYWHQVIWRYIGFFSCLGFLIQFIYSPPSTPAIVPTVDWLRSVFSIAWGSLFLVALGTLIASSLIIGVIFALPGVLVIGALNGFSPVIQWWVLNLPERRMAAIGALLIFCAFALLLVPPLCSLMSISF